MIGELEAACGACSPLGSGTEGPALSQPARELFLADRGTPVSHPQNLSKPNNNYLG